MYAIRSYYEQAASTMNFWQTCLTTWKSKLNLPWESGTFCAALTSLFFSCFFVWFFSSLGFSSLSSSILIFQFWFFNSVITSYSIHYTKLYELEKGGFERNLLLLNPPENKYSLPESPAGSAELPQVTRQVVFRPENAAVIEKHGVRMRIV